MVEGCNGGGGGGGEGRSGGKGSSFCCTSAKKLENLWSPACKLVNAADAVFIWILHFDSRKLSNKRALEKDKKKKELLGIAGSIF